MDEKQTGWYYKTDRVIMKILKGISVVSGLCLVGIMLVAFINVLGEKIFHTGVPGSTEIIQYLHVPVVFLAASFVTLDNGHTKIDLLSSKLPHVIEKFFAILGNIIAICICGFVGYMGFVRMGELIKNHTQSSTSGFGFPVWPFALMFAAGMFLLAISFAWAIVRQFKDPDRGVKKGPGAPMEEINTPEDNTEGGAE